MFFEYLIFQRMVDYCDEFKSLATKNDASQANQDNILKMLGAISHQMSEN
jgi:hypothetical protein